MKRRPHNSEWDASGSVTTFVVAMVTSSPIQKHPSAEILPQYINLTNPTCHAISVKCYMRSIDHGGDI
ncbi:hypothetical protein NPIL_463731 [Nephila pilipes]|uniref:Uncharacterized protein n=1 Tax=Nephila pilipes TaxID=299642 RepID=A0A8X6TPP4_NEPPI|nr:hypothetical protein NPIL_463731 [Nephila pilipes]